MRHLIASTADSQHRPNYNTRLGNDLENQETSDLAIPDLGLSYKYGSVNGDSADSSGKIHDRGTWFNP